MTHPLPPRARSASKSHHATKSTRPKARGVFAREEYGSMIEDIRFYRRLAN